MMESSSHDPKAPLTVVVPTLNEVKALPGLLEALSRQRLKAEAVIVADAGSTDGTAARAAAWGARVVPGGTPSQGRNAGARAVRSDLLLFLDADVQPGPSFLLEFLERFERRGLDVATCFLEPLSERPAYRLLCEMTNLYLATMQSISPHAPGCCILVRRALHEAIGGFDESLAMGEDHDYVSRASALGTFGVVGRVHLPMSVRRLESEGIVRLSVKYLYCELHALAGRPIHLLPFEYEYDHADLPRREPALDASSLRRRLRSLENPLPALSRRGWEALRRASQSASNVGPLAPLFQSLHPDDHSLLLTYLRKRLAMLADHATHASLMRAATGRAAWARIPLLDRSWERLRSTVEYPADDGARPVEDVTAGRSEEREGSDG